MQKRMPSYSSEPMHVYEAQLQSARLRRYLRNCSLCPPGSYVLRYCDGDTDTVCGACREGYFVDDFNNMTSCLKCRRPCLSTLRFEENRNCAPTHDRMCQCVEGYRSVNDRVCIRHRKRKPGFDMDKLGLSSAVKRIVPGVTSTSTAISAIVTSSGTTRAGIDAVLLTRIVLLALIIFLMSICALIVMFLHRKRRSTYNRNHHSSQISNLDGGENDTLVNNGLEDSKITGDDFSPDCNDLLSERRIQTTSELEFDDESDAEECGLRNGGSVLTQSSTYAIDRNVVAMRMRNEIPPEIVHVILHYVAECLGEELHLLVDNLPDYEFENDVSPDDAFTALKMWANCIDSASLIPHLTGLLRDIGKTELSITLSSCDPLAV